MEASSSSTKRVLQIVFDHCSKLDLGWSMEVFNEQLPNILAKITTQRLSELPTTTTQEEREQ